MGRTVRRTNGRRLTMHKLFALAYAAIAALSVAATAAAAAPGKETLTFPYAYVVTDCGFPISVEGVFTSTIIDFTEGGTGTGTLQLHQSNVGTLTGNGTTLRVHQRFTIFVQYENGVPLTSKHVGVLDSITGPNGEQIFFRTGQALYEVVFDPVLGFYVDGPLITRHGIRDDLDPAELCAAFE
jgi:hypothetical protein